ncbi:AAA family ATPase [Dictyobacter kobayashii]|uniref:Orc1-like AAA ATPase domain-containing protein n=1 Tax=Dictyobacter kobayashii TaxID=2014872 RepID=A0A402AEP7_9CHLR|nr:ATP-binding protein [Dictyobacter kobayashii]GCE17522.1 hypothetical protein KDK_13220 [Dictyobacter kobayashii]
MLKHSALHWDERIYLPLPFLKQLLLLAYSEQPEQTLEEILFIATERPLQLPAARSTALEIALDYLEGCLTIRQISGAFLRLNELLPPETQLSDPRWSSALTRLGEASREAMSSLQPLGIQARLNALGRMIDNLQKIRPNIAFQDQRLNRRVRQVIESWKEAAAREQSVLARMDQDLGHIDNPYKPGQVLEPYDPLFVGRKDLALQLLQALNKGSRRPTLLLQGERRMGKTSTLRQLSYLLGASYIPVIYNLQDPKIYARTATFLGTISKGIEKALQERGINIDPLAFEQLQTSSYVNDPMAYRFFEYWLRRVEDLLEEDDHTLLLAFDEFEKLDEHAHKGYLDLNMFLDWCRQIIQYRPRIALLFSGLHTFSDMGAQTGINWSNYFVNVQSLKVSFLSELEACQLILHPKPEYPGEDIFGEIVDRLIQQTNGHPFFVQALCSQLIDNLNIDKRDRLEAQDIERAVKQLVMSWDAHFDDLWKRCDDNEKACLLYICEQQEVVGQNNIEQATQREHENISRALRILVRRDLLIKNGTGYVIAAPILREWVQQNA